MNTSFMEPSSLKISEYTSFLINVSNSLLIYKILRDCMNIFILLFKSKN